MLVTGNLQAVITPRRANRQTPRSLITFSHGPSYVGGALLGTHGSVCVEDTQAELENEEMKILGTIRPLLI